VLSGPIDASPLDERAVRGRLLSPGSLAEALLFLGGLLLAVASSLSLLPQGGASEDRSTLMAGWGFAFAVAIYVMPAAFQAAQRRQTRLDLLSPRRSGGLAPVGVGAASGYLYFGLCLAEPVFRWLPTWAVLVAGACVLAFGASRALWKARDN
jgi:peptidoglycan/LPS O-acetylase OafA/YrhL